MIPLPKDGLEIPYLLWVKDTKKNRELVKERASNPVWAIALNALRVPHFDKKKIAIPIEIRTAKRGYQVEPLKIYLVGINVLVLSELDHFYQTKEKGGKIFDKIQMNRPSVMEPGKKYDFMHFIIKGEDETYEDQNTSLDMIACYVRDEEEFCQHLNLAARAPDYLQDLRKQIIENKLKEPLEKEEPISNETWSVKWLNPLSRWFSNS